MSKELNHFGVIADFFRQIGGHSSRFVLFCSFWRLFTIKMIKSVKVFPFSENSSLRCGHAPHLLRRHHYHGLSGQGVDRKVLKRHGRHHLHYRGCQSEASTVCQLVETSNMTNKQPSSLLICTLRSDFEGGRNVVLQPEKNLSLQNHFSATLNINSKEPC